MAYCSCAAVCGSARVVELRPEIQALVDLAQVLEALETRWVDGFEVPDTVSEDYETILENMAIRKTGDLDVALRLEELHEPTRSRLGTPSTISAHLQVCSECRSAATDLERLHRSLRGGFHELERGVSLPSEERIDAIIRRVDEDSGARILRRLRRPLRIVLWGAFYGFILLLCCVLAVALFKVIAALGD